MSARQRVLLRWVLRHTLLAGSATITDGGAHRRRRAADYGRATPSLRQRPPTSPRSEGCQPPRHSHLDCRCVLTLIVARHRALHGSHGRGDHQHDSEQGVSRVSEAPDRVVGRAPPRPEARRQADAGVSFRFGKGVAGPTRRLHGCRVRGRVRRGPRQDTGQFQTGDHRWRRAWRPAACSWQEQRDDGTSCRISVVGCRTTPDRCGTRA